MKCNLEELSLTMGEKTMEHLRRPVIFPGKTQDEDVPAFEPHSTAHSQSLQGNVGSNAKQNKSQMLNEENETDDDWFASLQIMPRACFSKFNTSFRLYLFHC